MEKLSAFTEKFKNLTPPDDALRSIVARILAEELGIEIKKSNIRVHNAVVYIKAPSLIKNEIFIRRESLLKKIRAESGKKTVADIK
ncbi:MAG: hypothetical protein AAB727_01690 [Patescibacteria group bacterium]